MYKLQISQKRFVNCKKNKHQDGGMSYNIWADSGGCVWNMFEELLDFLQFESKQLQIIFHCELKDMTVVRYDKRTKKELQVFLINEVY